MKIYINPKGIYLLKVKYVLQLVEKNQSCSFNFIDNKVDADLIWDHTDESSQPIDLVFYEKLDKQKGLDSEIIFISKTEILTSEGEKDEIAAIFYMVNCLQEYSIDNSLKDEFGRFKYDKSYQYRFDCVEENLVQKKIDTFSEKIGLKLNKRKSTFFISHDIDSIYGSIFQDSFWALKNMKFGSLLNILMSELILNPGWKNIDKIINLNSEYDVKSTFFWLVNKGIENGKIKNADYKIEKENKLLDLVNKSGFVNGLHKSCSDMSINDELKKGNLDTTFNRYHFLNFSTRHDWSKISDSNLEFDTSLGFAERYGFRNSYGMSFQPYDIKEDKLHSFIETPLNFMDTTFHRYMKIPTDKISDIIINFYEKNDTNCDFALLWHNNYFSNFKFGSFLKEYKKIMIYLYENKIEVVSPQDIVNQNRII